MKAKKLKSGEWTARYIDHYEIIDGKKIPKLKSVKADTEASAIKKAKRLSGSGKTTDSILISYAIDKYIEAKKNVLSPSTYRSYNSLKRNAFDDISSLTLSEVTGTTLQLWVSKYSETHKPKTVRNAYSLLESAIKMFDRTADTFVTFPQKDPPELYTPTDKDVKKLLKSIAGTDLEKAVILAALGTLRRSEICALTYDDISGNTITIRNGRVEKDGGGTIIKRPKNTQSIRVITLPEEAMKIILRDCEKGKPIVKMTPSAISNAFPKALKKAKLPRFRFHDLRAYSASVRHAIGIPDQYIMHDGGWKTDTTLKAIYRRTMADKNATFERKVNKHFGKMLK